MTFHRKGRTERELRRERRMRRRQNILTVEQTCWWCRLSRYLKWNSISRVRWGFFSLSSLSAFLFPYESLPLPVLSLSLSFFLPLPLFKLMSTYWDDRSPEALCDCVWTTFSRVSPVLVLVLPTFLPWPVSAQTEERVYWECAQPSWFCWKRGLAPFFYVTCPLVPSTPDFQNETFFKV